MTIIGPKHSPVDVEDDREIHFVVVSSRQWDGKKWKKVHVIDPEKVRNIGSLETIESYRQSTNFIYGYIGATYCGQVIARVRGGGEVGEFFDEALCWSCYHVISIRDIFSMERLFEHEVPEGEWS
jgi:hypothetical protein